MNINVYNLHEDEWEGKSDYIGRPSPLGNPFVIGKDGNRAQVIEKFKRYLWGIIKEKAHLTPTLSPSLADSRRGEVAFTDGLTGGIKSGWRGGKPPTDDEVWSALLELMARARAGERVNLLCYCKPLDCHGDVIKACLEWMGKTELGNLTPTLPRSLAGSRRGEGELLL